MKTQVVPFSNPPCIFNHILLIKFQMPVLLPWQSQDFPKQEPPQVHSGLKHAKQSTVGTLRKIVPAKLFLNKKLKNRYFVPLRTERCQRRCLKDIKKMSNDVKRCLKDVKNSNSHFLCKSNRQKTQDDDFSFSLSGNYFNF